MAMRSGVCGAAVLIAACLPMSAAKAALITETYDFTASGFTPAGSPVDPWTGSFTITFDPLVILSGPLALDAFTSNLDPTIYGTFKYEQEFHDVGIGDNCTRGNCNAGPGQAFFDFTVDASGNPNSSGSSAVIDTPTGSVFSAANVSVTLAPAAGAPGPIAGAGLPGVLAMLVGGLMWWRRKP